ncbi:MULTISPECIES: hypothetical protein [unclassified Paraburkholderia]|uniref:hypothetical protein n=1 Tax=unclassified Paraburkholderia TaxID=2615204 RepID=UPI002AB12C8A|nr:MULTISPECIES: hypothetical protein [unclassified Paraburkholderia]
MAWLTYFGYFNAAWTAIKTVLGWCGIKFGDDAKAPDENTQAVEVANKAGALSASEARDTRAQTEKELSANAAQTDVDAAAVRDAGSLSDGSDEVNRAIARSRAHPDSER